MESPCAASSASTDEFSSLPATPSSNTHHAFASYDHTLINVDLKRKQGQLEDAVPVTKKPRNHPIFPIDQISEPESTLQATALLNEAWRARSNDVWEAWKVLENFEECVVDWPLGNDVDEMLDTVMMLLGLYDMLSVAEEKDENVSDEVGESLYESDRTSQGGDEQIEDSEGMEY
ncbi:hypothetical protein FLAG1_11747 [Fusarium langsethiae]|uniref:Uncharacterized protein n=1 Tax=Fusarium langsethiae TaxID=179993 RepID=A0A0N0DAN8_FUSLA|nr:hypothetical protein FLAG1_11747 [Fusarium langsethiae]GKU12964.1 unnamed protein product [Fusarium langsethiae]